MNREADRPALVGYRPRYPVANPPGGVSAEPEATPVVEPLHGANQPEITLLDEILQQDAPTLIALRDGDHKAQVGVHEPLPRVVVPLLETPCKLDDLGIRQ